MHVRRELGVWREHLDRAGEAARGDDTVCCSTRSSGSTTGEMAQRRPRCPLRRAVSLWLHTRDPQLNHDFRRLTFILSLATLLTASRFRPQALRGLSRWTLAFVMHGRRKSEATDKLTAVDAGMTPTKDTQKEDVALVPEEHVESASS